MHYLLSFFGSAVLALTITPLALVLAMRYRAFDRPGLRKVHDKAVPVLGGVAITLSVLAGLWLARLLWPGALAQDMVRLLAFTAGGLLVFGIGLYDDLRDASVGVRFLVQFLAAGILVAAGFNIRALPSPFGGSIALGVMSYPFTMLWVVFFINAINFIDGLDGLAGGITAIAALTIFFSAGSHGEAFISLLALVTAGSMLGFLPFNFHPARIFMGDSGATFLGYALGAMTALGTMKSIATIALLIPIAALSVPIADTVGAVIRRTRRGQKFYLADKEHVHHLLITLGFSHQGAVTFLYGISAFFGILAILLSSADRRLISILVLLFLALVWVFLRTRRDNRE
ncbi:undecaprenyl/decaprenyl-phosphate alpha-N-acetylglucosaminyl 1-phosphate transferase [bacterium]|nr:undecaprenyl/decaprenyl-phosphate alpha-N-acetylglucosaminyl 1-phosphate transferase [bacterium]